MITEAMHLLSPAKTGPRLLAELVRTSGIAVFDLSRPPELDAAAVLMEKYLTLDRRGFKVFRTRRGRQLRRVLDGRS